MAYILLVRGIKGYWLENDLRYLYKEILKPYYKRLDDREQADYRDFKTELYNNKVDDEKSMIVKLRSNVHTKIDMAKHELH